MAMVSGAMLAGVVRAGQVEVRPVVLAAGPGTQELEYPVKHFGAVDHRRLIISGTVILSGKDFKAAKAEERGGGYAVMDGSVQYSRVCITLTEEGAKKLVEATQENSKALEAQMKPGLTAEEIAEIFRKSVKVALVVDGTVLHTFGSIKPDTVVLEIGWLDDLKTAEEMAKKINDALAAK